MYGNANRSSSSDVAGSDKSPIRSCPVYIKVGLSVLLLTVCISAYFFLKEMPRSITLHSSHLLAGLVMIITSVGIWGWRTGRSKATVVKSTAKLQQINEQLQKEIAQHTAAEDKARLKGEKANASSDAKRDFLASMSHEIRTPLNAIIGFGGILSEEELTEQQSSFVKNIQSSAEDLLTIINDILDFSKIEAGKMDTEMADCSLVTLFESVELMMRPIAAQKGLAFKVNVDPTVPSVIRTDPVRVRQCLINLTNNALKFTEDGHVYINLSLSKEDAGNFVRFEVEDTGIGIEPDKLDKIFKSFTQADISHTRQYGGTGLGLAITKKLAQLLGGSLKVKSEAGKGSVFTLSIPINISETTLEESSDDRRDEFEDIKDNSMNEQISGRVLVAEDSRANQTLVKIFLERMGLEVVIAEDGKIALSMVLAERFDLVLMDIQMPNMNGYDATAAIREKGIDVPVVALTAHAMKGDVEKCLSAGCNDYLAKPIDRQKLNCIINKYLNQKNIDENPLSCKDQNEKDNSSSMSAVEDVSRQRQEDRAAGEVTINWESAMRFCGDENAIRRVVTSILEDGPECIDAILGAIESNESKQILLYAHRLRGSALTIGIAALAEAAGKVEDAAHESDIALAASYVDDLRFEYQRTAEFLNKDNWMEISVAASCHQDST